MKDDLDKHIEEREKKSPGFKKKVQEALERRRADILAAKERCPHCDADLQGPEIPEESREFYGEFTHFSRKIGISNWDSVYEWKCPDCGGVWPRVDGPSGGLRTFSVEVKL